MHWVTLYWTAQPIKSNGENPNLVRGENNDTPEDDMQNDACRAREDKSDEERNVKPCMRWREMSMPR